MCYNQTAILSETPAHVRNPNGYMHPLPCWNNYTTKYNTTDNSTYVMLGGQQEDVTGVAYVLLFSTLVLLLALLYCLALRAGMVEASIRREQTSAVRRDSFDAMTLNERRQYVERVLKVKVFTASDSKNTIRNRSPESANVPIVISKPLNDSGDSATDIEDLSIEDCLDDASFDDDDNPKAQLCCAICLEKFRNGDEVSYSHDPLCTHEYHTTCIVEWLLKHMNCPYCRRCYVPTPPSVKKESISTDSSEPLRSSSANVEAITAVSSSNLPFSPRIVSIDIEMGDVPPCPAEPLPIVVTLELDERISL